MKPMGKKSKSIAKGAPSGMVISLLVHAAAFLLAGLLVVFNVVNKEEKKFVPPKPVERPKMKLKKLKVTVTKSAKPKSTMKIMSKMPKASMPQLELPPMTGMSAGLGGGVGGFEIMPELDEISLFGTKMSTGSDFVGTLYDFKRTRRGSPTGIDIDNFLVEVGKFTRSGWKTSKLAKYYKAPQKLYASNFMIPAVASDIAPVAFGERDMTGYAWIVHYKGKLVHPTGGKFRFWAQGDDFLLIRVNGEIVVDGSIYDSGQTSFRTYISDFVNVTADDNKYYIGYRLAAVGTWITLEPGVPLDMEVLIGEVPGGGFSAQLCIEEYGVEYPETSQGGPLLPMFKTAAPTRAALDAIYEHLALGEVSLDTGPIFCDYGTGYSKEKAPDDEVETVDESIEEPQLAEVSPFRLWTFTNGKTLEGKFVSMIGDKVVISNVTGKQKKIPKELMTPEGMDFIELSNPPEFNVDFRALSKQRQIDSRTGVSEVPTALQWNFGVKLKQTGSGSYSRELKVEYFAIGQQILDRSKFTLLGRGSDFFTPGDENERSHTFLSDNYVELYEYNMDSQARGKKKYGYLITITDERGEIIQHQASNKWLWENYDSLKNIPIGAFMDKSCARVYPTGPKATRY
jgi:hypothetical protein